MLGFVGQFQHALDAKSRLILPAKFRAEFERGGILSPNVESCVALWTPGEFWRQAEERLATSKHGGADGRQASRYWASHSTEVEFDKQGRFAVSTMIRDYAGLTDEVLIVGNIDHIELWNPTRFHEQAHAIAERFREGLD
jgi:MraZ protein